MSGDCPCLVAGLAYIARGWRVLVLKPRGKEPLTKNGVNDATDDPEQLRRWFKRWPNANIGIACGSPGPDVLDIDDLVAGRDALIAASAVGGPDVGTARGRQFYFLGTSRGTVTLGYGELRSVGSYVVAPPSIHPSGKEYTWVVALTEVALPPVPIEVVPEATTTAGVGIAETVSERVPYGERHGAIRDRVIRLIRGGILDPVELEDYLKSFYEKHCVLDPPPTKGYFEGHIKWALKKSRIGAREQRAFAERIASENGEAGKKTKRGPTGLENPPRSDAPLKEHREYVSQAGGWGDRIDVDTVVRHGQHGTDALTIKLTNGQVIQFDRQDTISTRGAWARTVTSYTDGLWRPVAVNEVEGLAVFRSLCRLADAPQAATEAEEIEDLVRLMVAACDVWSEHDLSTNEGRFDAIKRCHARGSWTPRSMSDTPPVLLVDQADARWHLRAGEVYQWLLQGGVKLAPVAVPGRMSMIGSQRWRCAGRAPRVAGYEADKRTMTLYRLPGEWNEP